MADGTAYLLDGAGGGAIQDWNQIKQWQPDKGVL